MLARGKYIAKNPSVSAMAASNSVVETRIEYF